MGRVLLVLYRHAESENNKSGAHDSNDASTQRLERQPDPAITPLGRAQAAAAAEWFAASPWSGRLVHVYVSPMTRALQTAAPLAAKLPGVPYTLHPLIFECGGSFHGPRSLMAEGYPPHHGLDIAAMRQILPCLGHAPWTPSEPWGLPQPARGGAGAAPRAGGEGVSPSGGWWRGGYETLLASKRRAGVVADWCWACADAAPSLGGAGAGVGAPAILLVGHGWFVSELVPLLLGITGQSGVEPLFLSGNAAITILELETHESGGQRTRRAAMMCHSWLGHLPRSLMSGQHLQGFSMPMELLSAPAPDHNREAGAPQAPESAPAVE